MASLRTAVARTRAVRALSTHRRAPAAPPASSPPDTSTTRGNSAEKRPAAFVDNAPGWNEDLATPSEAFVKADRETTSLDEMPKKTLDYVRSHHQDPEVAQTHAAYARDEVSGPLGNAGVGEFEGVVGNDDLGPDDARVESNGRVVSRRVAREGE